jgi:hypothetical protein
VLLLDNSAWSRLLAGQVPPALLFESDWLAPAGSLAG